ncbi:MAG: AAA family ATPase [Ktedonobacterales bacterium]
MPIACTLCGTQLPDEANFCLHCGKRLRRATHIYAIASLRGCVGKTTTAINLSACLAEMGYKTLVVDIDPLADATRGLGIDSHGPGLSVYELLVSDRASAAQVVKSQIRPNLSLLPAKVDLYAADIELAYLDQREFRLKRALDAIKQDYDFILIDCPSWLGIFTINALTAADGVILPLQCEYSALEGTQLLLNTIRLVRDRLNPKSMLFGVVLTMYDPQTKLSSEMLLEISGRFPKEKFNTVIARNDHLAEALRLGLTILEHEPSSLGASAYKELAEEIISRAARLAGTPI